MRSAALFDNDSPETRFISLPSRPVFSHINTRQPPRRRFAAQNRAPKPDYYLHDDRNKEDDEQQQQPSPPPPRVAPAKHAKDANDDGWLYRDPEGKVHGPFPSSKMAAWLAAGYFGPGIQVQRAQHGAPWQTIADTQAQIKQQVEASVEPQREPRPPPPSRQSCLPPQPPPREARSPPPPRNSIHNRVQPPSPSASRGNAPSSGRGEGRGRGRGRGRGGRGSRGRGGRDHIGADGARIAWQLFTGSERLAAQQPVWRYRDADGAVQERKVSPPDLPPMGMYLPLGRLLQDTSDGKPFVAASPDDIQHFITHGALPTRTAAASPDRRSPVAVVTGSELKAAKALFETVSGLRFFYIDRQERVQGPFEAVKMVTWFEQGWLKKALHVAAAEVGFRPPQSAYVPLAQLLDIVDKGYPHPFTATPGSQDPVVQAVFSGREGDWYYVDTQCKVQGPFEGTDLISWYTQGVLEDHSLVLQLPQGKHVTVPPEIESFHRLGVLLGGVVEEDSRDPGGGGEEGAPGLPGIVDQGDGEEEGHEEADCPPVGERRS